MPKTERQFQAIAPDQVAANEHELLLLDVQKAIETFEQNKLAIESILKEADRLLGDLQLEHQRLVAVGYQLPKYASEIGGRILLNSFQGYMNGSLTGRDVLNNAKGAIVVAGLAMVGRAVIEVVSGVVQSVRRYFVENSVRNCLVEFDLRIKQQVETLDRLFKALPDPNKFVDLTKKFSRLPHVPELQNTKHIFRLLSALFAIRLSLAQHSYLTKLSATFTNPGITDLRAFLSRFYSLSANLEMSNQAKLFYKEVNTIYIHCSEARWYSARPSVGRIAIISWAHDRNELEHYPSVGEDISRLKNETTRNLIFSLPFSEKARNITKFVHDHGLEKIRPFSRYRLLVALGVLIFVIAGWYIYSGKFFEPDQVHERIISEENQLRHQGESNEH